MRVLVVEDEPQIQAEVAGQLESLGYAVDRTGDGEEGLYFALEYPIDVAVVDIGLPGITGIELITALVCTFAKAVNPNRTRCEFTALADKLVFIVLC